MSDFFETHKDKVWAKAKSINMPDRSVLYNMLVKNIPNMLKQLNQVESLNIIDPMFHKHLVECITIGKHGNDVHSAKWFSENADSISRID